MSNVIPFRFKYRRRLPNLVPMAWMTLASWGIMVLLAWLVARLW